ncbi:nitrilase-related carbon-nitrogen hydrolase [Fodinicola feengrottensis]|uniref:nitrilase-related carbon-nitrogen hydrolase n=1 Tax=Fodinicola feengrottensis TaxID=435914 RepID=UPI00244278E7|nr:nitrilase-related carbon-nitrogen hydrolase [Fodinicola feengrottensis]
MPTVPSHPLRVAVAQAPATPGDLTGNAVLAGKLVRQAAAERAVLVVLPELFLPAYHPPALDADPLGTDLLVKAGQLTDSRLWPIQEAVIQTGIHAIVGASVRGWTVIDSSPHYIFARMARLWTHITSRT